VTRDSREINKLFVKSMTAISVELEKPICEISKPQFFAKNQEALSEWDIRKAGGFDALKKMNFAPDDNLEVKYGSRLVRSHINKVEKQYGQSLFYEREILAAVKEALRDSPLVVHPATKLPIKKTKAKRTLIAALSDTHYGSNIAKKEMHGLNEYNWTIAARRTALFMEQIAQFKEPHRKETDLVLQINGDIIAGLIHNPEWFVDLLTTQFAGTLNLLSQAISYLAQHFPRVTVYCTPGNHGRSVGKADKGRASTHKWDSYETMIYISLKEVMAQKHKNVTVIVPESPFIIYKVQGHNVFQSHGDTVVNVGNPGTSLNMASINNQINRVNSSDLIKTEEMIEILSVGHVHVPTTQTMDNGCALLINGCLSGCDPFAQSIGIFSSNPTQLLVESTEAYAMGDTRMIRVKDADKVERYDAIIRPFKGNL